MKKTIYLSAMLVITALANAQPYGQSTYPHSVNSTLSSGSVMFNQPGFIMLGNPNAATSYNFSIDRVDIDGNFNNPTIHFSNEYRIFGDMSQQCSGGPMTQAVGSGVNVIETSPGILPGCEYAVAGTFANGCFMSLLDNLGMPIPGRTFYFNAPQFSATPYNGALIIEEPGSTGNFYIAGCFMEPGFQWTMYSLKVDVNGTIIWSNLHAMGTNNRKIRPLGINISPYAAAGAPEFVLVGVQNDGTSSTSDNAFFMNIDGNTGNINAFSVIDGPGVGSNETWLTISPASSNSSLGTPGYVVGGYTNMYNANTIQPWVAFIDPMCTTIGWNDVVITQSSPNFGLTVRAYERKNVAGNYEYYAAVGTNANVMMAIKLDDAGLPFPGNSEFVYNQFCSSTGIRDMSLLDNSAGVNVGFHLYGNCGPDHYFVEACFNGVTGCREFERFMPLTNVLPGPPDIYNPTANIVGNLTNCPNFFLKANPVQVKPKQCGPFYSIPPGGSNARAAIATGVSEHAADGELNTFPNPVTDKLFINYTHATTAPAEVKLYNNLGQLVGTLQTQNANDQGAEVDVQSLHLESGIYMLKTTIDGVNYNQKIVYSNGR